MLKNPQEPWRTHESSGEHAFHVYQWLERIPEKCFSYLKVSLKVSPAEPSHLSHQENLKNHVEFCSR